jgi:hypothetical protein
MPDITVSSSVHTFMQAADKTAMRAAVDLPISQAWTSATLSGAYGVTITATGSTSVTLPTSGTLASTAAKISDFAACTSSELAGKISDETGTGALVFANTPTLVTPVLGVATATTINKVTITAPATSATLTITNGAALSVSGNVTLSSSGSCALTLGGNNITFTTSGATSLTLPTTGTVATLSGSEILSNKDFVNCELGEPISGVLTNCTDYPVGAIAGLGSGVATWLAAPSSTNLAAAVTGETGSGALVFATSPTLVTPNIGAATGQSLAVTGALTSSGGNIGYLSGAGGTVTQITSQTTAVTLNTLSGMVQMFSGTSISHEAVAVFQVNNNRVAQSDVIIASLRGGTNGGNTQASIVEVGSGYFKIAVANNNANGGTAETGSAIQINFAVFKATTAVS